MTFVLNFIIIWPYVSNQQTYSMGMNDDDYSLPEQLSLRSITLDPISISSQYKLESNLIKK